MKRLITPILAAALLIPTAPAFAGSRGQTDPPPPTSTVPSEASAALLPLDIRWNMTVPAAGWGGGPTAETATWPQTLGTDSDCGSWWQDDRWLGTQAQYDAILADGLLSHDGQPEDHAVIVSWVFTEQPACAPVIPPQPVDVVTITDGAPVIVCASPLTSPPTYTVTVTSTTTTTTTAWDGAAWVPSDTVAEASSTRTVDATEAATLGTVPAGCEAVVVLPVVVPPVIEPPVTEPPVVAPPVVTPEQPAEPASPVEPLDQGDDVPTPVTPVAHVAAGPAVLAETGGDPLVLGIVALLIVAAGGSTYALARRRVTDRKDGAR